MGVGEEGRQEEASMPDLVKTWKEAFFIYSGLAMGDLIVRILRWFLDNWHMQNQMQKTYQKQVLTQMTMSANQQLPVFWELNREG